MGKETTLRVLTRNHVPMCGTGGRSVNIRDAPDGSVATMLEDGTWKALAEWEGFRKRARDIRKYQDYVANEDPETVHDMQLELRRQRERLADRLADVVVAACDLAEASGASLQEALDRNGASRTERERING